MQIISKKKDIVFLLEEKFIFDNLYKILVDLSQKSKKLQDIKKKDVTTF